MDKKRHHYVPITYLKRFADDNGFLRIVRKGPTGRSTRAKPSEVGFRNFYYSQPMPTGGHDNNKLEDLFSTLEAGWGQLSELLISGQSANHLWGDLIQFIGFQRVRVPAFREAIEGAMANYSMATLRELNRRGELPPPPEGYPDILKRTVAVIDPHQSIHAVAQLLRSMTPLLTSLGYVVVQNDSDIDFITSDNPVSYYAIKKTDDKIVPYKLYPNLSYELMMPISPRALLLGTTYDKERFSRRGLKYVRWRDPERVRRANRIIAQFGYEAIFSRQSLPPGFIAKYGMTSPILEPNYPGFDPDHMVIPPFVFGLRRRLPKWDRHKDYGGRSFTAR